jgi:DNA-binding PadR family transcriptional regulator
MTRSSGGLTTLDYHVLLAMAAGPAYGYAIKEAVETESRGTLTPRAGSLYRVIARLVTHGLVVEATPMGGVAPHPGRERRYYALTTVGRAALADETVRLKGAATLADKRLRAWEGGR